MFHSELFLYSCHVYFSVCNSGKMLDLVVVLDFQTLSPFAMKSLQDFLKTQFERFHLDLSDTRVGIVTRRSSQPMAAWYLNSQSGGYPVTSTLKVGAFILLFV